MFPWKRKWKWEPDETNSQLTSVIFRNKQEEEMLKISFYAIMGFAFLLNAAGIASNLTEADGHVLTDQTPTPTVSPTVSPTVTPIPTPCYPDDPKKPCPSPSPTAQPVPTTSPTMRP